MSTERAAGGRVKSVEQGFTILGVLARVRAPMTLKAVAAEARVHPSKAHRYLASLVHAGMVEQSPDTGRYRLGPAALELGLAALAQLDLVDQAGAAMQGLCDRFDETVLLSVWGNNGATIIKMLEPARPVTVNVRVGFSLPLLSSATGLVFAAFLPLEQVKAVIRAELKLYAQGGRADAPTDMESARALMEEVRRRGISRVKGALLAGVNSMGAPIFDQQEDLAGVITVLGAADQIDITWNGPVAAALRRCAGDISRRLGSRRDAN